MSLINLQFFKIDFNKYLKATLKSIAWLSFVAFFGSLPLLLVLFLSALGIVEANQKLDHIYNDLFLPFLSCAVISEISFEAFLCKIKFSKYSYLFFAMAAAFVIGIVCIFYVVMFFQKPEHIVKLPATWIIQAIVITFTVVYSLGLKTILFVEEDKLYKS